MLTDIEIAQAAKTRPIAEIARDAGIAPEDMIPYGYDKAKLRLSLLKKGGEAGRLVLVTAITPTPAGEGKTTTTIGLADGLRRLGVRVAAALREPSLGPVFGVKGGAAGGGYAQVVPMEDINLHFTGDLHAITAANNLLAAMIDNHIHQGNALGIDPRRVSWRRCMDMNDRQLRSIVSGLGGKADGMPREDGFDITAASEVMAALCLAEGVEDLRARLGRICVGYAWNGDPVTAAQLHAEGAMTALLRDAMLPNLVQTLEGTPAVVHGGPFANIAHGCNSVLATRMALRLGDVAVTEAGFGADLGAEKFIDIKCRSAHLQPACVVLVATIRALKMHGGVKKGDLDAENIEALDAGIVNLARHLDNLRDTFRLPCVVALNRFSRDTDGEIALFMERVRAMGARVSLCEGWEKGGVGALDLAQNVLAEMDAPHEPMRMCYGDGMTLRQKLTAIATKVYRADGVVLSDEAKRDANRLTKMGCGTLPVCVAKTQYSFSDDPGKPGAPEGFSLRVRRLLPATGAGFVVALCGDITRMPGLPASPAAERIDVDADGKISGLF